MENISFAIDKTNSEFDNIHAIDNAILWNAVAWRGFDVNNRDAIRIDLENEYRIGAGSDSAEDFKLNLLYGLVFSKNWLSLVTSITSVNLLSK